MERQRSLAPPLKLWCVIASSGLSYVSPGTVIKEQFIGIIVPARIGRQCKKPGCGGGAGAPVLSSVCVLAPWPSAQDRSRGAGLRQGARPQPNSRQTLAPTGAQPPTK